MEKIVTITLPMLNPVILEEEGYQSYKVRMAAGHPIIKTVDGTREYHTMVAAWDFSSSDPIANGWRRAAREWLEVNPQ